MKNFCKKVLLHCAFIGFLSISQVAMAQYPVKIHSHNDYTRNVPFYEAYSQRIYSMEADMFYRDGQFYVSHEERGIHPFKTFDTMYLQPLIFLYKLNRGSAWADSDRPIQLLIEIKSDNTLDFMDALVNLLQKYPEVFDPGKNSNAVHIAITGKVPDPEYFSRYPSYIQFDGNPDQSYTQDQLSRVAMFSIDFANLSKWSGKDSLVTEDKKKVLSAIKKAHSQGKPIRFWGAPDNITAWNTFFNLGVDYINTDHVEKCADFFSDWSKKKGDRHKIDSTFR